MRSDRIDPAIRVPTQPNALYLNKCQFMRTIVQILSPAAILIALLAASCTTQQEKSAHLTPKETIDYQVGVKFMNEYKDFCDQVMLSHDTTLNTGDWINKHQLLSTRFIKRYNFIMDSAEKANPGYGLGFDPIFDAQDYTDGTFEIKEIDSAANLVMVIGTKDQFEAIVKVIRVNNKSVVDGAGIINIPKNKQRKI